MLILLMLILSGCSQEPSQDEGFVSNDTLFVAPLPAAIMALSLNETNLVVEVVVDGGAAPQVCPSLTVNPVNGTFSCNITLSGGSRTLTLVYSVIDATYGTVQIATTSGITVDVVPGQTTSADFSAAILAFDDTDGDGTPNLTEIDRGTDWRAMNVSPQPRNVVVTPNTDNLEVVWDTVPGASVYNIYMASETGVAKGNWKTKTDGMQHNDVTSPFTHPVPLSAQKTYCFVVTAFNKVGESIESAEKCDVPVLDKPLVVGNLPTDAAIDVGTNPAVVIEATFSKAMDGSTIDATTFTVSTAAGLVPGSVTMPDSLTSRFTPTSSRLALAAQHTATMTTGVQDLAGNPLATDFSWTFTTRDGLWDTATLIETDNAGDAYLPAIAMDANGNAVAVWQQWDDARFNIWSNRYVVGSGWGTATLIETDNAGSAYLPTIAMDANGNAAVVWRQSDGTRDNIWSNRYVVGSGWGTATLIEIDNAGSAFNPAIVMDANANAVAVWRQWGGTRDNIYSNRYVVGSGWGTATLIETDNTGDAYLPAIAMDANGNAVAVWQQWDGTRDNVYSNRYVVGSGWGTVNLIEIDNAGDVFSPTIAMDANGNAVAVWEQSDGTRFNIWSNRYVVGSGWGVATLIETDNAGGAFDSAIAMDANGNAVTVWRQWDGTRNNIWSNRYVVGSGWGAATLIETDNKGDGAYIPTIAMDANGNAVAVWQQSDGSRDNIWSNRYVVGSGWGAATLIETDNAGGADLPTIAMDANGNAVVVWSQSDGSRDNIWSNRFE